MTDVTPDLKQEHRTGQRREDVAGLDWSELRRADATWRLPRERSKDGEANVVPLVHHAMAVQDKLVNEQGEERPQWSRRGRLSRSSAIRALRPGLEAIMATLAAKQAHNANDESNVVTALPCQCVLCTASRADNVAALRPAGNPEG